jgi:N-acetylmuramoyl-L-alanine amidase
MSSGHHRDHPSPNRDARPAGVAPDTLVLHYTGMRSAEAALARLCDPAAKVSAHYLVDEDGTVFALIPEAERAWHAGRSWWRGRSGLNDVSVGVEIVNPGHEWGYRPFPEPQMAAVVGLAREIVGRWSIPPWQVVAHSDVAPDRKEDPGELFDWSRLAAAGVGLWPNDDDARAAVGPAGDEADEARALLAGIGYPLEAQGVPWPKALTAFQRRFRPGRVDGLPDPGSVSRLRALADLLRRLGAAS